MTLKILEHNFCIVQLKPSDPIPIEVFESTFVSVTKTKGEISIVCKEELANTFKGVHHNESWRALMVLGILDFSLTGVLSDIAKPLAQEKISIFAISTYNTDYILVKSKQLEQASAALKRAGFAILPS